MGIFNKLTEPVFIKADSLANQQLEALKNIKNSLTPEGQKIIEQDIRRLEYGIAGEQNIAFELKNSHMPMYIMQDIYIEHNGLTAQIDYIIVTRKIVFLIECKNLYGNIEINSNGDFIRIFHDGRKIIKEGIYSPITQNNRHMELLKTIRAEQQNKLMAFAVKHWFYDNYKSIVVLANPKTILTSNYAKKEISDQVIRADQLIHYIKDEYKRSQNIESNDKQMEAIANNILNLHKERKITYTNKYAKYLPSSTNLTNTAEHIPIYDMLKKFRLKKSQEEHVKPYMIFNNKELDELVAKKPTSKEELMLISGFGKVKTEKYGDDIIAIINGSR